MTDFRKGLKPVNYNKVTFTNDQQKAMEGLVDWITSPFVPSKWNAVLKGAAGTGKTFITKHIIDNCGLPNGSIVVSAPTHKASKVISRVTKLTGKTIQSLCGMRPDFNIEKFDFKKVDFNCQGRINLKDYKLAIIDEASMINYGLKRFIEVVAKENEVKVLFTGDGYQLPPVGEKTSTCLQAPVLYELEEVMRQLDSNPLMQLLKLCRYDIKHRTNKSITQLYNKPISLNEDKTQGYFCCDKSKFTKNIVKSFNSERFFKDINTTRIAAFTNVKVNTWNHFVRNNIIEHGNNVICKDDLLMSYTTIVDDFGSPILNNSEEYIIRDISDYNYNYDKIVMKGFLVSMIEVSTGKPIKPIFILDHNNPDSLSRYILILNNLIHAANSASSSDRSACWKRFYEFKDTALILNDLTDEFGKTMSQRGCDYGFALTVHRTQGSTYDDIFVDLADIVYTKTGIPYPDLDMTNRLLYVALSRARNRSIINLQL